MNSPEFQLEAPRVQRAAELISCLFDDNISRNEKAELELMVVNDDRIRRLYVCLVHLHNSLCMNASALGTAGAPNLVNATDQTPAAESQP